VNAGENAGHELRHEHVVAHYTPVAAWPAAQPQRLSWQPPAAAAGHAAQVVFVLVDAATTRPLNALQLPLAPGC
jgi:hypothetical protein